MGKFIYNVFDFSQAVSSAITFKKNATSVKSKCIYLFNSMNLPSDFDLFYEKTLVIDVLENLVSRSEEVLSNIELIKSKIESIDSDVSSRINNIVNNTDITTINKPTFISNSYLGQKLNKNLVTENDLLSNDEDLLENYIPNTKYQLSDNELMGIAALSYQEQGSIIGSKAEASLIANQYELNLNNAQRYGSIYNYARNSGWFYNSKVYMNNTVSDDVFEAIKDVLVDGNRTLPLYVIEHDCILDIGSVTNNGIEVDKNDYNSYKKNISVIHQNKRIDGASSWIFHSIPSKDNFPLSGDPFGYTENSKKIAAEYIEKNYSLTNTLSEISPMMSTEKKTNIDYLVKNEF